MQTFNFHVDIDALARPLRNVDRRHSEFAKDGSYEYLARKTCK